MLHASTEEAERNAAMMTMRPSTEYYTALRTDSRGPRDAWRAAAATRYLDLLTEEMGPISTSSVELVASARLPAEARATRDRAADEAERLLRLWAVIPPCADGRADEAARLRRDLAVAIGVRTVAEMHLRDGLHLAGVGHLMPC